MKPTKWRTSHDIIISRTGDFGGGADKYVVVAIVIQSTGVVAYGGIVLRSGGIFKGTPADRGVEAAVGVCE